MRLFTAIELPAAERDHLVALVAKLRPIAPSLRWTPSPNLHITLKFLGNVPDQEVLALCSRLKAIQLDRALSLQCFEPALFPSRNRARIVAIGIAGADRAGLINLFAGIDAAAVDLGFPRENRRYNPHVTLARARAPLPRQQCELIADTFATFALPPQFTVDRFALVQSHPGSTSSQYTTIATFGQPEFS